MSTTITARGITTAEVDDVDDEPASGVSWGAVFAGAAAAAALSLILLVLGVGLGFSVASPWTADARQRRYRRRGGPRLARLHADRGLGLRRLPGGAAAHPLGQRASRRGVVSRHRARPARLGGGEPGHGGVSRLGDRRRAERRRAGRRRSDQVARPRRTDGPGRPATTARHRRRRARQRIDGVFRRQPVSQRHGAGRRPERRANARRGLAHLRQRLATPAPWARTTCAISARWSTRRTGLTPADAEKRVADAFTQASKALVNAQTAARQAADEARRAAAYSALWMFVALLAGAFFASLAALAGGRQRDDRI